MGEAPSIKCLLSTSWCQLELCSGICIFPMPILTSFPRSYDKVEKVVQTVMSHELSPESMSHSRIVRRTNADQEHLRIQDHKYAPPPPPHPILRNLHSAISTAQRLDRETPSILPSNLETMDGKVNLSVLDARGGRTASHRLREVAAVGRNYPPRLSLSG